MKKNLLLTFMLFAVFSAYAQTNTVVFDFYNQRFNRDMSVNCQGSTNLIPTGSHAQLYNGYEFRGVTGNPQTAAIGIQYYSPLFLTGSYVPTGGWHKTEDSFSIKYPFRKGYKYTITTAANYYDADPNYGNHTPTLQMQLTNSIDYQYARDCSSTAATPIFDLTATGNPAQQYNFVQTQPNITLGTAQFNFTPDQCYSYLWVAAKPNESYENLGNILINKITITETPDLSIAGNFNFCPGNVNTFTLNEADNLYAGNDVVWSTTGSIAIQGSSTNSTVAIIDNDNAIAGDYTQIGTLTATVSTSCGNIVITKDVSSGLVPPGDIWGFVNGAQVCGNSTYNAGVSVGPYAYSRFEWTVSGGTILSGQNTPEIIYKVDPYPGSQQFYITCHTYDWCNRGISQSSIEYGTIIDCDGGGGSSSSIVYYPNPTSNTLTISNKQNSSSAENSSPLQTQSLNVAAVDRSYQYKILNNNGKVLKQGRSNGEDVIIDVKDVASGTYFLHVEANKKVIEKQIVIKH